MSTVVQKRGNPAVASMSLYLTQRIPQLGEWVKDRIDPAALVRFALFEIQQSEKLQKCSPSSIYLALLACAQVGLEPGGVKQEAFIVPYKGVATFQLGWRGIVKLAMRSGEVAKLSANVVREGDDFDFDLGTDSFVRHRPTIKDRGEIIGAYAFAKLNTGELDVEWMDRTDLTKIRDSGHSGPAWKTWADQMYRKAPIRRLGKRLPLGGEYMLGARLDELAEGNDFQGYQQALSSTGAVIDIEPTPEPEKAPPSKRTSKGVSAAKKRLAAAKSAAAKEPPIDLPPPIADEHYDEADAAEEMLAREKAEILAAIGSGNTSDAIKARIRKLPASDRDELVVIFDAKAGA